MTDLEAPIRTVTVYADRALVTRHGQVTLEAGEHELRVNNLPQFVRESLRAGGQGPQGARILNVDITTAFYSRPPEAELQRLQNDIEQLERRQQLVKAQQDGLTDRRKWLRSIGEQSRDFARGLAFGRLKAEECSDFFRFMSTQAQQDAEEALALNLQIQRLNEEIQARQRELQGRQGPVSPDRLAAVVSIEMASAGVFELELSYLVLNASWKPQYDVRVEMNEQKNAGSVELTYIGLVQQSTGEAWDQVELALSTARPSLAAVLPELTPWYLNVYTPPPPMPFAAAPAASGARPRMAAMAAPGSADLMSSTDIAGGFGATVPPPPITAEVATATVEHTGTALVFRVGRAVDIPSDNSPHKTTIARDNLPCEFDYVSAPALEPNAHLRATIQNTTERILLKGDASIFLQGEYVGTTLVKATAPNERFKIFLGIDDDIKIKREPTERSVDKGNLLQNDLRRNTYGYRITVHNYARGPRKIEIRDRLPVSQHERVKVKIQQLQPPPVEESKLELLRWEFTLPADGEQRIEYRFMIEQPQGLRVTGLPSADYEV